MPTARLRYTLTAGATTALLLLTGCTSDSEAGPPPLPTVSPAPTVGAFAEDHEAEPEPKPKPETASEFITLWVETSQQMQVSGDSVAFRELSRGCPNCLAYADHVDRIYRRGGYIKTKGWKVLNIVAPSGRPKGRVLCLVDVRARPTVYKDSSNQPEQRLKGGLDHFVFDLRFASDSWRIREYRRPSR